MGVVAISSPHAALAQQTSVCVAGGAVADAANTGLVSDCDALLKARDTLAGSASLNWSENTPITDWDGILEGSFPSLEGTPLRVTRLYLQKSGLMGTVSAELAKLTNLKWLYLYGNDLSGEIPDKLGEMANLERLYLNHNDLSGQIPGALGRMSSLIHLFLHRNRLTGTIPADQWDGLDNLVWLSLYSNDLTGGIPTELSELSSLERLYLNHNDLTGQIPGELGKMSSLTHLLLHRNELTGTIPADQWDGLDNLVWLSLYGNDLTGGVPTELTGLAKLKRLYLHENRNLGGTIPAELGQMSSLTHLLLLRTGLSGPIPNSLGDLSNLVWLALYGNDLSGEIPKELGGLTRLQRLYLHYNGLTGEIPSELGDLGALTNLWLNDNNLEGEIPTSLNDLNKLVRWRLRNNGFTGCVPAALEVVEDNDFDSLGLPVCEEEPGVVDPTPVSVTIAAGEAAVVTHGSGARIEIPAGATTEPTTVTITEVIPPESVLDVGRTFDFAVTDASGEDVELQRPVTLRLPYSLSEGKNEADVAVLRWNEDIRRWEAVYGGVVDGATRMVTVATPRLSTRTTDTRGTSGVTELGRTTTGTYDTPMEYIARAALSLAGKGVANQYDAGFKHLVSLHVKEGFRVPFIPVLKLGEVGASLIFDVDDLLSLPIMQKALDQKPITGEGDDHYVTFWLNLNAALSAKASASPPFGISFSIPWTGRHIASPNHNVDPSFDASFSAMTLSYPVGEVSFLNINENGNIHPVEADLGTCVTCELELEAGVSFADVRFNLVKGELNTDVLNEALAEFLKPDGDECSEEEPGNTLPNNMDPSGEVSQEFVASELICSIFQGGSRAFQTIIDRSIAPFTSYEDRSPDEVALLDPAQFNRITAVAGGHDVNGDRRGDLVFPSRDEGGSPLSEIPLTMVTTSDRNEDRDYYVELWNQKALESIGWIIRPKGSDDDRYEFEAEALSINATEWLVTTTDDAPASAQASFNLRHDKLIEDVTYYRRTVTLWKDRVLSDLSIEATGKPTTVLTGDTLTYEIEITNRGHHPAKGVKLHLANMLPEGFVLRDVTTPYGSLNCEHENFVGLTCDLLDLIADRSVEVTLEFEPVQCLPGVPACFPPGYDDIRTVFSVESDTEDPALGNNSAEVRTRVKHATDRDALVALYNATDGDNWRDNTNWLSDAPLGRWYGVTTDSDGRVTKLVLPRNDLSGEMPEELGQLRRLTHLVLWDNDLRGEIPEDLGDLSELICLLLWGNDLDGEIPSSLGDLANLKQLDLLGNDLDGSIPSSLGDLSNLTRLHLAENDLSGTIPSSLGDLTNLESLYLFRNELEGQIPSELANLTKLNWLYMSENEFTGCIPAGLRDVPNHDLGSLNLDYCAQLSTSGGVTRDDSIGPRQNDDFDAEVVDIIFPTFDVFAGGSGNIQAKFKNLSSSTGQHGGEATFDLTIYVEPPSGAAERFSWDNRAFTLNQERTFTGSYTFASAGTYTVWAEIYDINGWQNGWNADNRFDQRIETFTVREPVTVQISPSSYTVNEGDVSVDITVTMSESVDFRTGVLLATRDGTAVASGDYRRVSTTIRFPNNTTSQTRSVFIFDDIRLEAIRETFTLQLQSISDDTRFRVDTSPATVTIVDDDEVTVEFQNNSYLQIEGRSVELCLVVVSPVISYTSDVPYTVHLSYTDLHGVGLSGPSSLLFDRGNNRRCGSYEIPNDNVVEEDMVVEFTLHSVTSDSPGVASRVNFGISMATLGVINDSDAAFVEFEHPAYSVTEGDAVELCAVLRHDARVAFPFTANLSYTDPDGVLSSGPTSLTFGALDAKSCGEFQTNDDDVGRGSSVVSFRLTSPPGLDSRIMISRTTVPLTVIDDDSPTGTINVTVTSNWLGRTVTVDGTVRTTPYTTTWNSGSSHTLDVPSPQRVSGGQYVFSSWSHGGPKSQTVSPTSHTTYTANFTFQADPTSHPPAAVGVSPLPPFQQDVSLISGFTQTFVASASDQDGNISEWEWFVDDVSRTQRSIAHTGSATSQVNIQFMKPGSHTVKATFTDSTGLSDSFSWEVEVTGPDLTTCP